MQIKGQGSTTVECKVRRIQTQGLIKFQGLSNLRINEGPTFRSLAIETKGIGYQRDITTVKLWELIWDKVFCQVIGAWSKYVLHLWFAWL